MWPSAGPTEVLHRAAGTLESLFWKIGSRIIQGDRNPLEETNQCLPCLPLQGSWPGKTSVGGGEGGAMFWGTLTGQDRLLSFTERERESWPCQDSRDSQPSSQSSQSSSLDSVRPLIPLPSSLRRICVKRATGSGRGTLPQAYLATGSAAGLLMSLIFGAGA